MSKEKIPSEKWQVFSKINLLLWAWLIVGIVAYFYVLGVFTPWSWEPLGVPQSPLRTLYGYVCYLGIWASLTMLMFSYSASKPRWMAPRGQYIEGQTYKVWSPYRLVGIAVTAAMFAAAGIFRYEMFDLCALPAAISAIYFDPIVCFNCLYLGGILRAVAFRGEDPLPRIFGGGIQDGAHWAFNAIFYRWITNPNSRFYIGNVALRIAVWNIVLSVTRVASMWPGIIIAAPSDIYPVVWLYLIGFLPVSVASSVVGSVVSEFLIRTRERRK